MKTILSLSFGALLLGASLAWAAGPAADPVIGTWKLNVAKSKFISGPVLKNQTRTYSQSGDSISLVNKSVGSDGKETTTQTTYKLDGKDYPVTGAANWDTLSAKQVDTNTTEFTFKKGGKVVGNGSRTVSKDGKTMTSRQSVTDAKGEKSEAELVFDKQ
jgi:hypothetical protein